MVRAATVEVEVEVEAACTCRLIECGNMQQELSKSNGCRATPVAYYAASTLTYIHNTEETERLVLYYVN